MGISTKGEMLLMQDDCFSPWHKTDGKRQDGEPSNSRTRKRNLIIVHRENTGNEEAQESSLKGM